MATFRHIKPPIAILTDFGYRDHYVGVMKGVIARIAPNASIIDITHGIPPQSVIAGAIALRESWRHFPAGTIFLAVVDPGVGTARLPIAIRTRNGSWFVGPDNGLMWLAADEAGIKTQIELVPELYHSGVFSRTFHGRDVFAPAAAYIWQGRPPKSLGHKLATIEKLALPTAKAIGRGLAGEVIYVDGYGNLVTNISRSDLERLRASFPGRRLLVKLESGGKIDLRNTYGEARSGAPLATIGSFELMEIAVRDGNAAVRYAAGIGTKIKVVVEK
jgi:S-adenosylmethionine hydrolase